MSSHTTDTKAVLVAIAATACLLVAAAPRTALAAPSSPFVASGGGVWDERGNNIVPEVFQTSTSAPVRVETGGLPIAYGDFRSEFGANRFAIQTNGSLDREVYGGSVWSDGLTVNGAGQGGLLTLSVSIGGSVSGLGEMGYALFVSEQPYDFVTVLAAIEANNLGFWALTLPNSSRVISTGVSNGCSGSGNWSRQCGHVPFENFQGTLNLAASVNVPFTDGQPLYVLSAFSGGVGRAGGIESFLNSANFGVTVPAGGTLASLSGTTYAAAVPEPSSALLFIAGLVSVLLSKTLGAHRAEAPRAVGRVRTTRAA